MRNFLLFDSVGEKNDFLLRLLEALAQDGWQPVLLGRLSGCLAAAFKERGWRHHRLRFVFKHPFWLTAASPWLWLNVFCRLLVYKKFSNIRTVFCLGWPAKFLLTWPAGWLGWQVVWLEQPNFRYEVLGRLGLRLYRLWSARARLVCFSLTTKLSLLSLGVDEDRLLVIWPGIEIAEFQNQVNLFQSLAKQNYAPVERQKFFTIGTVIDFQEPQRTEVLMRAVQEAAVIVPNLRLIVIGDGPARKQAAWLSKQLALESAVWLVGSQSDLKKWYANFDIFVVASFTPGLDDFLVALAAMVNGVPVIAPKDLSLEDCFLSGQAGLLLSLADAAELSAAIIQLAQDQVLRKNLSINAKRVVKDFFTLERAKNDIKLILETTL